MNYDDIQSGAPVTVTTREDGLAATVISKFKSSSGTTEVPAGTEYVELETLDGTGFFEYPRNIQPR